MSDNLIESISSGTKNIITPLNNLNRTAIENLSKIAELQFSTAKYLADIGINQLKAAAEIDNLDSARSFATNSLELARQVNKKLLDDSQKLFSLSSGFKGEIQNLFKQATDISANQAPDLAKESTEEQKAKKAAMK